MSEEKLYEMKNKLIGFGIFLSAVSFLYEYLIDDKNGILTAFIMLIDIAWLALNAFYLSFIVYKNVRKSVANAILGSLLYFSGISGLIMTAMEKHASQQLFLTVMETLIYLGPMIILFLPLFYILGEILG